MRRIVLVLSVGVIIAIRCCSPALASTWTSGLASGSSGAGKAGPVPAAPTGVSADCPIPLLGNVVVVSWTAVARATSYDVLQSTAAATGPYVSAGTTSSTSWTTPSLAAGSYWFEVKALVGTNWMSAASAASARRTITLSLLCT